MKVDYKGFEINVEREKCLAGWSMLYFYVMEKESGYMLIDSFTEANETIKDQVKWLKESVDSYIKNPEDWEE